MESATVSPRSQMRVQTITANSASEALSTIHETLGPDAVVLDVRQLPRDGLARLWRGPRIEVLACVPDAQPQPQSASDPALADILKEIQRLKDRVEERTLAPSLPAQSPVQTFGTDLSASGWRAPAFLQGLGVLPRFIEQVMDLLQRDHGPTAPASPAEELNWLQGTLRSYWRGGSLSANVPDRHVFVGPLGSGKTTCLCKWLTQTVLVEAEPARVLRLDTMRANTAELLDIYGEILRVPIHRNLDPPGVEPVPGRWFVDIPGTDWRDSAALDALAVTLTQLGECQVHLVLNLAYDPSVLLAQVRAFEPLPINDLVLTHLDEEPRWGKAWNLIFGTKYSLRFLSTGQNIPGDFLAADPDVLLQRQFVCK